MVAGFCARNGLSVVAVRQCLALLELAARDHLAAAIARDSRAGHAELPPFAEGVPPR